MPNWSRAIRNVSLYLPPIAPTIWALSRHFRKMAGPIPWSGC